MFYFVINSLTFSVHAQAVMIDKGTKEIKLIFVAEGCLPEWHVQWTEKQISMAISISGRQVCGFLWVSDKGVESTEKENWIAKGNWILHVICRERGHIHYVLPTDMVELH